MHAAAFHLSGCRKSSSAFDSIAIGIMVGLVAGIGGAAGVTLGGLGTALGSNRVVSVELDPQTCQRVTVALGSIELLLESGETLRLRYTATLPK